MKSKNQLMKDLAEKFNLEVVDASEFYGYSNFGIWMRSGLPRIYYTIERHLDGDHPLDEFIQSAGWFVEPYDSETFLVYPI